MSRLEDKLIELGYVKDDFPHIKIYIKRFRDFEFWLFLGDNEIIRKSLYSAYSGYEFEIIEKVVDEIQKDLEVLKEYEM